MEFLPCCSLSPSLSLSLSVSAVSFPATASFLNAICVWHARGKDEKERPREGEATDRRLSEMRATERETEGASFVRPSLRPLAANLGVNFIDAERASAAA